MENLVWSGSWVVFDGLSAPPGSRGAFCELRPSDQTTLEFYAKLGCFQRVSVGGDLVVMGTSL